jgi:hypothetical protein
MSFDMFVQSMVTVKTLTEVFKKCASAIENANLVWIPIGMGS